MQYQISATTTTCTDVNELSGSLTAGHSVTYCISAVFDATTPTTVGVKVEGTSYSKGFEMEASYDGQTYECGGTAFNPWCEWE